MPNTEWLFYQTDKSSHRRCSIKEAVLKNFAVFTGKHLYWSLFLITLQIYEKETLTQGFSCCEILRITILKNICF